MKKYNLFISGPAESFRLPMAVTEIQLFSDRSAFPVCPRCNITLEREYQSFCDRCGQALCWKSFKNAVVVSGN